MIPLFFNIVMKRFWFRYYCFSIFKSEKINRVLLWSLIPMSIAFFYYSSYQELSTTLPHDEALKELLSYQWYIYFNSKEFTILFLSIIVWSVYRNTRDAAIATVVLVKSIYDTIGAYLNLSNKYATINLSIQLLIYVVATGIIGHAIWRYWKNARKERNL